MRARLKGGDEGGEDERRDGHKVPHPDEPAPRVDRPPIDVIKPLPHLGDLALELFRAARRAHAHADAIAGEER